MFRSFEIGSERQNFFTVGYCWVGYRRKINLTMLLQTMFWSIYLDERKAIEEIKRVSYYD